MAGTIPYLRKMLRTILILAIATAAIYGIAVIGRDDIRERIVASTGLAVPDTPIRAADGSAVSLKDWQGEVTLLTLWATWCPECHEEMPKLAALGREIADENVVVRPVTIDTANISNAQIFAHMKARGFDTLPLLRDEDYALFNRLGARGTPTTFIIDKFGQIVGAIEGGKFDWTSARLRDWLLALAAARTAEESGALLAGR